MLEIEIIDDEDVAVEVHVHVFKQVVCIMVLETSFVGFQSVEAGFAAYGYGSGRGGERREVDVVGAVAVGELVDGCAVRVHVYEAGGAGGQGERPYFEADFSGEMGEEGKGGAAGGAGDIRRWL